MFLPQNGYLIVYFTLVHLYFHLMQVISYLLPDTYPVYWYIIQEPFYMCHNLNKCKFHKQTNWESDKVTLSFVGLCMPLYDFVCLCMTMYDYMNLCLTLYDYVWLCMTMYDYVWLCMTMFDYVWLCLTLYERKRERERGSKSNFTNFFILLQKFSNNLNFFIWFKCS